MTGGAGSRGLLALLPRIARYARPHRAPMALGFGLSALGIALDLAKPLPLAIVLDSILGNKPPPALLGPWFAQLDSMAQLGLAAAAIVVIAVCRGMITMLSNYLTIDVGQRMVNDLRIAIWTHLQKLSLRFHNKQQTGDLLFRVMADTYAIQGIVMNGALPADQRGAHAHRDVRDHGALRLDAGLRGPGGEPAALPRDPLADHPDPRPRHRGQGGGERALQPRGDRDRGGEAGAGLRARGPGGPGVPGRQREEPGPVAPPLRHGDPLRAGGGVPAGRGHRGDRVARRAAGDERRPDHRRADRVPLLPARPLPADPEPEPEPRRDQFGPRRSRARLLGGGRGARRQGRARRADRCRPSSARSASRT